LAAGASFDTVCNWTASKNMGVSGIGYLTGLIGAFVLFGVACAAGVIPTMLLRGRPDRISDFVKIWIALGPLCMLVLAGIVGPAVLSVKRVFGAGITVARAAVFGAALSPGLLLVSWLLFRENNETVGGLLQFWARVPGELLVGLIPHTLASAFFAGWLVSRRARAEHQAV
jgi:hypothetical protein